MENTLTRTAVFDINIPVDNKTMVVKTVQTEIIDANPVYISLN